jgi:acetate kinase
MKVLVLNAGSSSLKYQVIDMETEKVLAKGVVERIGSEGSRLEQSINGEKYAITQNIQNHTEAFMAVMKALTEPEKGVLKSMAEIGAIGHRVLHSGEDFKTSVRVDKEVIRICKKNSVLGPLHMPANISCIEACMNLAPSIPNVAVFDTVFHSTMPAHAYMYAIDYADYEKYKVRKYGFHGTSHKYVSSEAVKYLNKPNSKIITCHLGNGSSMAAVVDGRCIDTTMGLTPLEGLIMGTRSGDLDPAVVGFLSQMKNMTACEVITYLNKSGGFFGVAGVSDFRDLYAMSQKGNERATLAIDMFAYRIKKYIGAYAAAMNGLDCVVFTGGIGENAYFAREKIMTGLEYFGIDFDFEKNRTCPRVAFVELHKPKSKVKVIIIPTNEELVIAREAKELSR